MVRGTVSEKRIKRMLKRIFTLIFLLATTGVFAQAKKDFSNDPKMFEADLKAFFAEDKRPDSKEILDKFTEEWEKPGNFTSSEQTNIIAYANQLLKQRMRTNPDFTSVLQLVMDYKANKVPEEKLNQYFSVANSIIVKNKRDLAKFTGVTDLLFSELAISKNESRVIKISNNNYTISYSTEPIITFPAIELMMLTKQDTMGVYQTSGVFYPLTDKWAGKGGTVYWTRVGFAKDQASAQLKKYNWDVRGSDYTADSVMFSFPRVFAKPIMGKLEDKATTDYLGNKATYPRFYSYQNVLSLKNVFKNIDYQGGFGIEGSQIYGTGTDTSRAVVTIKYNNKVVLRALSKAFVITPDKISASKAAVSMYIDKDSMYHSQLIFNYQERARLLTLSRDNEGLYASPFFDNYHMMEMEVGNILWHIDSANVNFRTIGNPSQEATFYSADFFSDDKYQQLQGILDYNPLQKVKQYVDQYKEKSIAVEDLAKFFNSKPEFINNLLFLLANNGYIYYDYASQRVIVKDKLLHYVLSDKKLSDYDNMHFSSVITARPNASLNLESYDLKVEGVTTINLSDSQSTYVVPKDQTINVRRDRNMAFSGAVHSGRFDFYGKDFLFDYAKFNVVLKNVDSVKFKFPEYKDGKIVAMHMIQNSLQNVNGFLYIDEPNNKSGQKRLEDYPIFECNKESYVYYDKPNIFKGVYKRDRFYFKINPFTIKNLDKFTAEGLQFPGTFVSASILPVFPHALTIQEDYSLGFKIQSPPGGYQMYKDKGKGNGLFSLSNAGLRAKGEIEYLASKTTSDNIILFPDSMNAASSKFVLASLPGGKYPPALGTQIYEHWMPYSDSMYIIHGKEPLSVYNGKINFSGDLILTPATLVGTGSMVYQTLNIAAKAFAFSPSNIKSSSGDIKINTPQSKKLALQADNVSVDLDLDKDYGKFQSNVDTSKILLPSNRFSTTLNVFTYDLKENNIDFQKNKNQSANDAYFVSNNPEQQALKFQSEKAKFDLNSESIKAQDVPFILLADSRIYTPNKELVIEKDGNIASIKGGIIVTSDKNEYYRIYDAFVNVFSKNKFTGYGTYDYRDKNGKVTKVKMNDIRTTDAGTTVAKADLKDTNRFYLTPGIRYMGAFTLMSTSSKPLLSGFVQPDVTQRRLRTEWVQYADSLDSNNIVLNLLAPKSVDAKDLYVGTFISLDSNRLYNLFYGKKYNAADPQVFGTVGKLVYDEKENEYKVGPDYMVNPAETDEASVQGGNLFVYRPVKNQVYTEGAYDMGANLKQVEIISGGTYTYNYNTNKNLFDMTMTINVPMNEEAAKIMSDSLMDNSFNAAPADLNKPGIANALAVMIKDKKDKDKVVNELLQNSYIATVDATQKAFVISSVEMTFNDSLRSFISKGYISLANSGKAVINKQLNGIIEITKSKGNAADKFGMILEAEPGSYHYFSFEDNILYYLASDYIYIDKVAQTASKLEKSKSGLHLKQAKVEDVGKLYTIKDTFADGSK
jgi:hypothetical protein